MPNRDYAARAKAKKSGNKLLILIIIILLLLLSGLGLWVLNASSPSTPVNTVNQSNPVAAEATQKNGLPSRPEEIYSYIRDLETREVPVDKNSKLAKLTKEQELQILQKQEEEKRRLEQQAQQTQSTQSEQVPTPEATEQPQLTEEELAAKKEQEKKAAEEKRKQAELKKQQELAKKAEQEKQKAEQEKQKAAQQTKIVATAKPAAEVPKSVGKYGLQCGAFKNKAQAENMQARLAMAGYNAKISSNAEWNRVFVGPIGDRAAASAAQSNARSVAECLIVGM